MESLTERCFVCGGRARHDDPGVPEEYYGRLWCHGSCLNSADGVAWRERQKSRDSGYARYLRLSTVGLPMECPACRLSCRLSAKARGMSAGSWEACCTACSHVTFLDGYAHGDEYQHLVAIEHEFLLDASTDTWRLRVEDVAKRADRLLREAHCQCGSPFSVAAAPRCPNCRAVVLDSYFHYAQQT